MSVASQSCRGLGGDGGVGVGAQGILWPVGTAGSILGVSWRKMCPEDMKVKEAAGAAASGHGWGARVGRPWACKCLERDTVGGDLHGGWSPWGGGSPSSSHGPAVCVGPCVLSGR